MSRFIKSVSVEVDADIYSDDIDDDTLREICEERGIIAALNAEDVEEMYYAFKLGKHDRAVELARKIAQDVTGKSPLINHTLPSTITTVIH